MAKSKMARWVLPVALLTITITQPACVVLGGYSSGGGWFIWPGGLGLVLLLVFLYLIFGRRR